MWLSIIGLAMFAVIYFKIKKQQEETKKQKEIEKEEEEAKRKAREEQERKNIERLELLKQSWKESELYNKIISELTKYVLAHNEGALQKPRQLTKEDFNEFGTSFRPRDVLGIVIRPSFARIYHYIGKEGFSYNDIGTTIINDDGDEIFVRFDYDYISTNIFGNLCYWKTEKENLHILMQQDFSEMGYSNLDQEQIISLSNALREGIEEKFGNMYNFKILDEQGFIVLDFDK